MSESSFERKISNVTHDTLDERTTRTRTRTFAVVRFRLQQLQNAMVGGEQAANEELKQKRRKKLKHVEERRVRLAGASLGSERLID